MAPTSPEPDCSNNDLHRDIGMLDGRLTAVERDQHWIRDKLLNIDSKLNWLLGILLVVSTLVTGTGWYMVVEGIPPLGTPDPVEEPER